MGNIREAYARELTTLFDLTIADHLASGKVLDFPIHLRLFGEQRGESFRMGRYSHVFLSAIPNLVHFNI
jgi:hypothetical protein